MKANMMELRQKRQNQRAKSMIDGLIINALVMQFQAAFVNLGHRQEKRFVWAVLLAGLTLAWTAIEMYAEPLSQNAGNTLRSPRLPKCSAAVFFGERKVMDLEELRANALVALRAKGYQVSERGKLPRIRNQRTESVMLPRMPEHGEALAKARGGTDEKVYNKTTAKPEPP